MISAGWHDDVITGGGNEQSEKRSMNMNKDILKGKKREIMGRVKQKRGKLSDNELAESEGKSGKLLGLLPKKYRYIRDKARTGIQR